MSAIRSFLGKLPRPSCRQAVVGATAASAAAAGIWYLQQNTDKPAPAPVGKLGVEEAVKKEAQPPAEVAVANKAQPAGEDAATKKET